MRTNTKNITPKRRRSNHLAGRCFRKAAVQQQLRPMRPVLPLPLLGATSLYGVDILSSPFPDEYGSGSKVRDVQPYLYNGKELEQENGLDWYDYAARFYDAALCRFTTVDPHAENYYSYSPYAYCGNNPVNRTDPTGKDWRCKRNDRGGWDITCDVKLQNDSKLNELGIAILQFVINKIFSTMIQDATNGKCSGTITFTGEEKIGHLTPEIRLQNGSGDSKGGNSGLGSASVVVTKSTGENRSLSEIASDFIHETLHTVRFADIACNR